jgi:signal transduction histidine kinase
MSGENITKYLHSADVPATASELAKLKGGRLTIAFENRYRRKDGGYRTFNWTAVPENGLIHAVGRDITQEKIVALALRQSQNMEAVGQLTSGIAHHLNNLLQGISGSLDFIHKRVAQRRYAELEHFISWAIISANRAATLTHGLLAFSRKQPLDPRPVRLNSLIGSMQDMILRYLGEGIRFESMLAGGLWLTWCDPQQLESAILNLVFNACDAMPNGGKVTIETSNTILDAANVSRQNELKPGQYVCISVSDTGIGMSSDTLQKAFEPFFSTKPIGQGMGLGLSMIYGFARQSEGCAIIDSEIGQGTKVKLYLPQHSGADSH